jgi:hypothetical protein
VENIKFAWFPVKVTSGKRVWLRSYVEHRVLYDSSTGRPPLDSLYFIWTETSKEKTWRLLKESVVQTRNVWNDPALTKKDKIK